MMHPRAKHFQLQVIRDKQTDIPVQLPKLEQFIQHMKDLRVKKSDNIVVYDSHGFKPAPRAWWMFKVFSAGNCRLLNGGLPKWVDQKRQVEKGPVYCYQQDVIDQKDYSYQINQSLYFNYQKVMKYVENMQTNYDMFIVDSREKDVFQKGKIDYSLNLPQSCYFKPDSKEVKQKELLQQMFQEIGIKKDPKFVLFTCQRGITACGAAIAYLISGGEMNNIGVYDGSYSEYEILQKIN